MQRNGLSKEIKFVSRRKEDYDQCSKQDEAGRHLVIPSGHFLKLPDK